MESLSSYISYLLSILISSHYIIVKSNITLKKGKHCPFWEIEKTDKAHFIGQIVLQHKTQIYKNT